MNSSTSRAEECEASRETEPAKDGRIRFTTQTSAKHLPRTSKPQIPEKELIDHGFKWCPSKKHSQRATSQFYIFRHSGEARLGPD